MLAWDSPGTDLSANRAADLSDDSKQIQVPEEKTLYYALGFEV